MKQKGFTLIEIVLVIALVGLTGTLLISLIDPAQQFRKSNDAQRKTDLKQLQAVFELYRADQGDYPDPATFPSCGSALAAGQTIYLQKIPCDPKTKTGYKYDRPTANTYTLSTCLENVKDPQKDNPNNVTICADDTKSWSYTLTNP